MCIVTFCCGGVLEDLIAENVIDLLAHQRRLLGNLLVDAEHVRACLAEKSHPVLRTALHKQHVCTVRAEQHHVWKCNLWLL